MEVDGYNLTFEYIKGIKNTLADAVSRLVKILPDVQLEPEPEGFEFGEIVEKFKNEEEMYEVKETENGPDNEPIPEVKINWHKVAQE